MLLHEQIGLVLVRILYPYKDFDARFCSCKHHHNNEMITGSTVEIAPCPQQMNSSDCGVFTLAFAEALGAAFLASKGTVVSPLFDADAADESGSALQRLNQPAISAMRRSILDLIGKLAEKGAAARNALRLESR